MEKESAEKATTESENSVTSGEPGSLAENKQENTADSSKETTDESSIETPELIEDSSPEENQEDSNDESEKSEEVVAEVSEEPAAVPDGNKVPEEVKDESVKADEIVSDNITEATAEQIVEEKTEAVTTPPDQEENKATVVAETSSEEPPSENAKSGDETKEVKDSTPPSTTNVPEAELTKQSELHNDESEHHEEFDNEDFTKYSKEDLVEVVKKLGKEENPYKADKILQIIAPLFNKLRGDEKSAALKKFIAEGGKLDDFQYKPDELSLRFDANYKLIKDKKNKRYKEQELARTKNLVIAEQILEELREFMDSEESSASFTEFKVIQQKWKDLGDVPSQQSRTLWANYNALIHRFYDQRSIYFELKELDRRKNYESKLKLCEKAEAMVKIENLREAIRGLNDLHHEFKHLGPVPKEVQEELWQRFKAASDKVYERRKAFVNELKVELHENLVKKEALVEKIKAFVDFDSEKIKEWNEKTKELLAFQKEWDTIGGLPKEKAKVINKQFWGSFKKFFSNKHQFFKKLDADRDKNLTKKQELLEKANELKVSEDWEKTANELKVLQNDWRETGPVPEKFRKKLYEEFKEACDQFFNNRRNGLKTSQDQYKVNLKKKKEIIAEIKTLVEKADDNLDKFNELRKTFAEAGYVPKKNIGSIKEDFHLVVEKFLNALTVLNIKEKTEISLEAEFSNLAKSEHSQSELYQKEQAVRRQISKYENDIALWQNNLEFFAKSKSTDKLREEVNKKIEDAKIQLDGLKRQLKMLRSL